MAADERYDIVVVGGGHNGTTIAAYLAKCGLSVCIVEERPECGGAQENTEPVAGARMAPHAIANYGGAAPGWEQLELWKYGFRMDTSCPSSRVPVDGDGIHDRRRYVPGRRHVSHGFWQDSRLPWFTTVHPGVAESDLLVPSASPRGRTHGGEHPVHAGLQEACT